MSGRLDPRRIRPMIVVDQPVTPPEGEITCKDADLWSREDLVKAVRRYVHVIKNQEGATEAMRQFWEKGMTSDMAARLARVDQLEREKRDMRRALDAMTRRALAAEAALKAAGIKVDA